MPLGRRLLLYSAVCPVGVGARISLHCLCDQRGFSPVEGTTSRDARRWGGCCAVKLRQQLALCLLLRRQCSMTAKSTETENGCAGFDEGNRKREARQKQEQTRSKTQQS